MKENDTIHNLTDASNRCICSIKIILSYGLTIENYDKTISEIRSCGRKWDMENPDLNGLLVDVMKEHLMKQPIELEYRNRLKYL